MYKLDNANLVQKVI